MGTRHRSLASARPTRSSRQPAMQRETATWSLPRSELEACARTVHSQHAHEVDPQRGVVELTRRGRRVEQAGKQLPSAMSATDPVKRDRVDPAREVVGARRTAQRFLESVLDGVIDTLVRPGGGDEGSDEPWVAAARTRPPSRGRRALEPLLLGASRQNDAPSALKSPGARDLLHRPGDRRRTPVAGQATTRMAGDLAAVALAESLAVREVRLNEMYELGRLGRDDYDVKWDEMQAPTGTTRLTQMSTLRSHPARSCRSRNGAYPERTTGLEPATGGTRA